MGEPANRYYIGLDDTDNRDSRGTGHLARNLVDELTGAGLGTALGVTRHQLLVHPDIPYTSHNSSACIELVSEKGVEVLAAATAEFLVTHAAAGSDPGLCVARPGSVDEQVQAFGRRAKVEVLRKDDAVAVAREAGLHLSEHGGTGQGIVGALAAVGLRETGADGRFLWLMGIREMKGVYTASEILSRSGVRAFLAMGTRAKPSPGDPVDVGERFRPVLIGGVPTLLISPAGPAGTSGLARWWIVDKEIVKRY